MQQSMSISNKITKMRFNLFINRNIINYSGDEITINRLN